MAMLHDASFRAGIEHRLRALRADSPRRFGRMSPAQALWHCNEAMEIALGKKIVPKEKAPLPGPIMKFLVINLPWPKGAPTLPALVVKSEHDFEAERSRCLRLIEEFCAKDLGSEWPVNPVFGSVCGRDVTRLHAKHLNHHLAQFGV
jgi:DinB superfamily